MVTLQRLLRSTPEWNSGTTHVFLHMSIWRTHALFVSSFFLEYVLIIFEFWV